MHTPKAPKASKVQKHKNAIKQKHKMLQENKNKKFAQKTSKGKKVTYSLICVFVLFACVKKRKKRKVSTMLSIGAVRWCVKSVWTH